MVNYQIRRANGVVEQYNAAERSVWTAQLLRADVDEKEQGAGTDSDVAEETVKRSVGGDGTVAEVRSDRSGKVVGATVKVSNTALASALKSGAPVSVPATIPVGQGSPSAQPVIHVEVPTVSDELPVGQLPQIAIPVTGADSATVALQRQSDGSWKPVMDCRVEDGKLILPVEESCDLVICRNLREFPDVDAKAWYADAVAFVTARGVFNGTNKGFEPNGTMTRAMIAQVLYNLDRRSAPGERAGFRDVDPSAWYADAVGWIAGEGIVQGYRGAFSPDAPVSRQDLVTILYRYAQAAGYPIVAPAELDGFRDADNVASYAREAMAWAVAIGAISGMGDGTLAPDGTATRAQVAKIMQAFICAIR